MDRVKPDGRSATDLDVSNDPQLPEIKMLDRMA
jgi:hypothetical protein